MINNGLLLKNFHQKLFCQPEVLPMLVLIKKQTLLNFLYQILHCSDPSILVCEHLFHLLQWGILDISIILNDTVRMKKWVDNIFVADPARGDTGERELWAGKVAFELGDLSVAKEYLDTANQKSRGRCFGVEDAKYLKFLKNNK